MKTSSAVRVYGCVLVALVVVLFAAPASAQYKPRPLSDPATGEVYHIEGSALFWFPSADITVSSQQFGIQGSTIDFKNDLGLQDQRLPDLRVVLRPSKLIKLRFEYIPISYDQSSTLARNIVFNGQSYPAHVPINTTFDWKAYRFTLETDIASYDRWFLGLVLDAKYTDVQVNLATPLPVCDQNGQNCQPLNEFTHAQAPIPAIGGIGRYYVVPNISITAEVTGFKLPDSLIKNTSGHYVDVDVYGTVNVTNTIGAQVGFRSLDVGYLVKTDSGDFTLKGLYFGLVARY